MIHNDTKIFGFFHNFQGDIDFHIKLAMFLNEWVMYAVYLEISGSDKCIPELKQRWLCVKRNWIKRMRFLLSGSRLEKKNNGMGSIIKSPPQKEREREKSRVQLIHC